VVAVLEALTGPEISSKYSLTPTLGFELAFARACLAVHTIKEGPPPRPRAQDGTETSRAAAIKEATTSVEAHSSAPPAPEIIAVPPPSTRPPVDVTNHERSSELPDGLSPAVVSEGAGDSEMDRVWTDVVSRMRDRSKSLQALIRSGYLLKVDNGEVTVGFLHSFHRDQVADPKRRRMLEEVLQEVLGASYRVECVHASKDQIEQIRGAGAVEEDDGFIDEVAERLRQHHARQIKNGNS
jgi:DNA polymerase-3 subunit gamma/tau